MPIRNEWAFDLWKSYRKLIFCSIFALMLSLVVKLGTVFDLGSSRAASFVTLIILACGGTAYGTTILIERLLFGRIAIASLSVGMKIVLIVGTILAIGLAVWDGINTPRHDSPPTYVEPLTMQMFKNVKVPTSEEIDRLRQLSQQRSPTSQQ